jgi:type IV pilus assembly protein PilY1
MTYPIPSDLLLQDTTGDEITDRIYVGDLGGQLWRIDLGNEHNGGAKGVIVAKLGGAYNPDKRSFFYPPGLARIDSNKNIITAVTGARPNPLALGTSGEYYAHDRFYAILDGDEFPTVSVENNLENVTNWSPDSDKIDLRTTEKAGWYFDLRESDESWIGEKGMGKQLVSEDNVYFVTYTPPSSAVNRAADGSCGSFNPGFSRFYAINLFDGGPAFDKESETDFNPKKRGDNASDRSVGTSSMSGDVNSYYPSDSPNKLIGPGTDMKLQLPEPPARIFWLQK